MTGSIGVIILAAGLGRRFREVAGADKDKLLADCTGRDGAVRSVIEHVLVNLPSSLEKRVLVTRNDRPQAIRMAQAYGCNYVALDSPGLGDSIAAGVQACPDLDGWLIALGDMPFILPSSFERVMAGMREESISVPVLAGEYGHPVGFGRALGPKLMTLSGVGGAKALFAGAQVVEVSVDDPGVTWDIDVPEALVFK
ncbi:nucleotidyltransferase family protein [Pseudomonas sp. SWRI154]|uniref:nucleotidyltransferase family protein n=1 Tax=Pseudomonas sp. SWRI154 TaxID=2745501 RepID=UPI0016474117|nr:nucleotidyltransferase family protein [Pseudomonas sp. SWRI154]MBC3363769.1 nucleotidyltransferase family protein [Pseudomonas sp. SWRI154]